MLHASLTSDPISHCPRLPQQHPMAREKETTVYNTFQGTCMTDHGHPSHAEWSHTLPCPPIRHTVPP